MLHHPVRPSLQYLPGDVFRRLVEILDQILRIFDADRVTDLLSSMTFILKNQAYNFGTGLGASRDGAFRAVPMEGAGQMTLIALHLKDLPLSGVAKRFLTILGKNIESDMKSRA